MVNHCESEQFRKLFERSRELLSVNSFSSEEDTRTRTIVGINLNGPFRQRGIYRLSEVLSGQTSKYTLIQDTANGLPLIRGAVIENEAVTKTVGSSSLRGMKMAVDLMRGFTSCERYLSVNEER